MHLTGPKASICQELAAVATGANKSVQLECVCVCVCVCVCMYIYIYNGVLHIIIYYIKWNIIQQKKGWNLT